MPDVSVIIPSYNSAKYLAEAVDSVLSQTFRDFEVLVIDDGSTDNTEKIAANYAAPVRYIRQENSGVAVARNHGVNESRGRYVAFLDADDTWRQDKLEVQVKALSENPGYRACYTAFTVVSPNLTPLNVVRSWRRGTALEDLLTRGNVIGSICSVICERSLFETTGGFDPSLSQCADWDMWVRMSPLTDFLYIDAPLVTYRQHASNMSRNAPLLERDSLVVLKKGFDMPGLDRALRRKRRAAFARNYMVLAGAYFHAGKYGDSAACAARSVAMDVRQFGRLTGFPVRAVRRALTSKPALVRI
jgi:glycosyltransferase involved in cell wall biosynthesis